MKVGFSGTREGMSVEQLDQLGFVLACLGRQGMNQTSRPTHEFHYGTHETVDLKADRAAANLAHRYGWKVVPHHAVRGTELKRDREMVAVVDILIAAPSTDKEEQRSGTWATVRYMRALRRPVVHLSRGK